MHHSQLKVTYPDCPFLWDYDDMTQLFFPKIVVTNKESLLQEINNHIVDCISTDYKRTDTEYRKIIQYLIDLTDEKKTYGVYDEMTFISITQKIPKNKNNMWINFHTSVYHDENDNFLSKELSAQIAWSLIPILGNTEPLETKYLIVDTETQTYNNDNNLKMIDRILDPMTYEKNKIDNQHGIIEANIKNIRVGRRNFIRRSDPILEPPIDQVPQGSVSVPQPRFKQIEFNNNTRASAGLIRERLNSTYKMNRMRNNPDLMKQQKRVDLSLRNISQKISETARSRSLDTINSQHVVIQDQFDYIHDNITIQKVNQILRFGPNTSGKIKFNLMDHQNNASFITILRYEKHLHVTFHKITFE